MTRVYRAVAGVIVAVVLCQFGPGFASGTPTESTERVDPHHDPNLKTDETCSICHDVAGYLEGAHGNPETGVYRLPELTRGDCLHCHDFGISNLHYLFMPYNTNLEQRAICLFCHDGVTATAPQPPPGQHQESSTTPCVTCHDAHIPDEGGHGGYQGVGCEPCHGHDEGYEYAPGQFSQGNGTFSSHSAHTEDDSDDLGGPFLSCDACHDTTHYPHFKSGAGHSPYNLADTDVCDGCHSEEGAYNGLRDDPGGSVGAKDNWNAVYNEAGDSLLAGNEKWCIGCHDAGTSVVDGVSAPNVELYYVSGHGRTGAEKECLVCHDTDVGEHIDGEARTYSFDSAYYGPSVCGEAYTEGYRLRRVDGAVPLMIPGNYGITYGYNAQTMKENAFRLCFDCHDMDKIFDDTPGDGIESNFKASLPNPPRNYSYAWGSGADVNEHVSHIMNYVGPFTDSDWDAGTVGPGGSNGCDAMTGCFACHNVHGAAGIEGSTNEVMVRDGNLAGRPDGYGFSYLIEDGDAGGYPWVTSSGATASNSVGAVLRYNTTVNNMCGGGLCHNNPTPPAGSSYDATGSGWGTLLEWFRPWASRTIGLFALSPLTRISHHSPPEHSESGLTFTAEFHDSDGITAVQVVGYSLGAGEWVDAELANVNGRWIGGPTDSHDWVERKGYYFRADDGLSVTFVGCGGRRFSHELGHDAPEVEVRTNTYPYGGGVCASQAWIEVQLLDVTIQENDLAIELNWSCMPAAAVSRFQILRGPSPYLVNPAVLATVTAAIGIGQSYRDEMVAPGQTYYYWIEAVDHEGFLTRFGPWGVDFVGSAEPRVLRVGPNPTSDLTTVRFYVSEPCNASLEILEIGGRLIRTLRAENLDAGIHDFVWDLRDHQGHLVPKGMYFYSVRVGQTGLKEGKLIVLR